MNTLDELRASLDLRLHPKSGFAVMPDGISMHNGCNDRCDMLVGPCACGAWHRLEDWPVELLEYLCR